MQLQDSNTQLLYGFLQSICGWAMDNGYRDIASMKNLLKLAMIDACRRKYNEKPASAAQMALVTDLGISLRNVQYSLKALDQIQNLANGFVKVRQIQREIFILLTHKPQTLEEILAEVSYLIHAPYDLQKRTLQNILDDLKQKGSIYEECKNGRTTYRAVETHVGLFDSTDVSARLSGLLNHIDAYKHTIGQPFFKTYSLHPKRAREIQEAIQEYLIALGETNEDNCQREECTTKPYFYYLGCAPLYQTDHPHNIAEAILEVIKVRFRDPDSPSMALTHWYHLTPASAQAVFAEVSVFIDEKAGSASRDNNTSEIIPFAFYLGMADRKAKISTDEVQ